MNARTELNSYLDQFRERLRKLVLARGGSVLAVAALLVTLAAVWFGTRRAFADEFMQGARLLLLVILVAIAVTLFWLPLRKLRRTRAVPEIERRAPGFDGRIETYEGLVASERRSPFLVLLAEDALNYARKVPAAIGVSKLELSVPTAIAGVAAVVLLGIAVVGPGNWRYGVRDLWLGWFLDDTGPPQSLVVEPGDITVRRGGDLTIDATAQGFDPASMQIYARFGEDWQSTLMDRQADDSYSFTLFAVRQPVSYYVEAAGIRSPEYTVNVVDLPEVSKIRLTYDYPEWTRLEDAVEDPGYDIRAVAETEVRIEVETSEPLTTPALVIGDTTVEMTAEGLLSAGSLTVAEDGEYFVSMMFNGERVQVSDEYFITVIEDQEPEIKIVRPGRDWRASPIEEVTIAVDATDDFGIESAEILYSVNGSDWTSIPLSVVDDAAFAEAAAAEAAAAEAAAEPAAIDRGRLEDAALLILEDLRQPVVAIEPRPSTNARSTLDQLRAQRQQEIAAANADIVQPTERTLEPGDLISYYAVVKDRGATVQTDLFFVEVQPFDRDFTQGDSAGGGGGGQEQQDEISRRQKEILVATWNLIREQNDEAESFLDEQQLEDNARMLADLQRTLVEQAQSLSQRAQARNLDGADPRIAQYIQFIELAIQSMGPAADRLEEIELQAAVAPEQQALTNILRAEALITDIQVTRQQGGGGGGGGAARDFAELFELEMDLERNQYETEDRAAFDEQGGADQQQQQVVDEAVRKLQELARRQEELAEEMNRNNQQMTDQDRWAQRELQRETEELLRELEQLQQQLAQAQQQAQQGQQQGQQGQPGQQGQQSAQAGGQQGQPGQQGQQSAEEIAEQMAQVEQTLDRLRNAQQAMNRAGGQEQTDIEAARRAAQAALDQLQAARDDLAAGRQQQAQEAFADLSERSTDLYERQRQAAEDLQQAIADALERQRQQNASQARLDSNTAAELSDERYDLAAELAALEEAIQEVAQEFRQSAPNATQELNDALADLQEAQATDRLDAYADEIWRGNGSRVAAVDSIVTSALRDLERATNRAEDLAVREVVEGEGAEEDPNAEIVAELQSLRRQIQELTRQGQQGQQGQGQGQQGQGQGQGRGQGQGQGQQAQQGQPGGQAGGNAGGNFGGVDGFNVGGNYGPGGFVDVNRSGVWDPVTGDIWNDPALIQALNERFDVAGQDLIDLGAALRNSELSAEELAALRELGERLRAGLRGNPELLEAEFLALVNLTEQLELSLQAEPGAEGSTIRTEAPAQVPQGFEDPVAEYYRRLSRTAQ